MRVLVKAWFTASVFLATGALGQETTPEVETVVIDAPLIEIASPDIRSLAITLMLDLDHDQYLTAAELDTAIAEVWRDVDQDRRRARTRYWLRHGRARSLVYDYSTMISPRDRSRLGELSLVRQRVIMAGSELSLVSKEFHGLLSHLPPEQRHALLEADVAGNNDGTVTVREFYLHNRRLFSKKTHFESDFGEEAYLEVLRLLGAL